VNPLSGPPCLRGELRALALQIPVPAPQYRPLFARAFSQKPADRTIFPMRKLLVANRSEIAIRVFRAAAELGLGTVAVYTYEDRFSLHRFKADESYLIGPPAGGAPVKGYLDIPALIAVAKEHEVDAIHPGYGFLAENAELSRACAENGITFVGPSPELLEAFGDKTAAKRLAKQANVPTVPGTEHGVTDPAAVQAAAKEIGFPVI